MPNILYNQGRRHHRSWGVHTPFFNLWRRPCLQPFRVPSSTNSKTLVLRKVYCHTHTHCQYPKDHLTHTASILRTIRPYICFLSTNAYFINRPQPPISQIIIRNTFTHHKINSILVIINIVKEDYAQFCLVDPSFVNPSFSKRSKWSFTNSGTICR